MIPNPTSPSTLQANADESLNSFLNVLGSEASDTRQLHPDTTGQFEAATGRRASWAMVTAGAGIAIAFVLAISYITWFGGDGGSHVPTVVNSTEAIAPTRRSSALMAAIPPGRQPSGPTIDLLKLVDPNRDSIQGRWPLDQSGLQSTNGFNVIEFPLVVSDIVIQAEVFRQSETGSLTFGVAGSARMVFDQSSGRLCSLVDYAQSSDGIIVGEVQREQPIIAVGKKTPLVLAMDATKLLSTIGEVQLFQWNRESPGAADDPVRKSSGWGHGAFSKVDTGHVYISTLGGEFQIH